MAIPLLFAVTDPVIWRNFVRKLYENEENWIGRDADLGGGTPPPPGTKILLISCSFWGNLAKSYVGAPMGSWRPLLGEIRYPPLVVVDIFPEQWRIQDFPNGGALFCHKWGGAHPVFR